MTYARVLKIKPRARIPGGKCYAKRQRTPLVHVMVSWYGIHYLEAVSRTDLCFLLADTIRDMNSIRVANKESVSQWCEPTLYARCNSVIPDDHCLTR